MTGTGPKKKIAKKSRKRIVVVVDDGGEDTKMRSQRTVHFQLLEEIMSLKTFLGFF